MIGWHIDDVNPHLQKHLNELLPPEKTSGPLGARVLVPLCGKTVDMAFLARRGLRVLGVEGVRAAIDEFAAERSATGAAIPIHLPEEINPERLRAYAMMPKAPDDEDVHTMPQPVILIEGDFLAISPDEARALVPLEAAFDRGGLVAVEPEEREGYIRVLADLIAPGGRVLFIAVEHDAFADGRLGPPYEVTEAQLQTLCSGKFDVKLLAREDRLDKDKGMRDRGLTRFHECAYLLTRHAAATAGVAASPPQ